ncbi:hypothetical protein BCR34DRAFT_605730 [Clohesyomyces aquaticus]|uniref:RING-type domain-containing protein n=1 Tax=Clohesyomyces aquaticus TaxID=1231657 RepID=A0A1Y1YVG2_9PLEO|nr:hypothetical protein BCR34DRAFT_605730 [Clohesyomyces aquaticus]
MTALAQGRNRGAQVGLGAWQKESGEDRLRFRFLISPRPQVTIPRSGDVEEQGQRRSLDIGVGDRVEDVRAWSRDGPVRRRPRALTMDSIDVKYDPSQWKNQQQIGQKQEQGNRKQPSTAVQVHAIECDPSPPLATTPNTPRPNRNTNFSRPLSVISPKTSSSNEFQKAQPSTPEEPQSQTSRLPQTPPQNIEIPERGSSRQIPQTPPPETPISFQQTFRTAATDNTSAHPSPRSSRWTSALTSIRRRGFSISSGPLSPQRKGKSKPSPLTQGNLKRLESQTVVEGGDAVAGLVHLGMVRPTPSPMRKRESMPLPPSPFFSPDLAKEHFGTLSRSPTPGASKGHQRAQSHSQFLSRGQVQRLQNQNQLQYQHQHQPPHPQQSLHSCPLPSHPAPAPPLALSPAHLPPIKRKPTPLTLPSLEKHLPPYPSPLKDKAFHTAHSITLLSPKSLRLTCSVCKDMKELSAFPTKRFTKRCAHNPHTCKECMERWVGECVESRGGKGVVCPECGEGMGWGDVRDVVGGRGDGGVLER